MCTLIVLHRCVPGKPLVVAANRDEFRDRADRQETYRRERDTADVGLVLHAPDGVVPRAEVDVVAFDVIDNESARRLGHALQWDGPEGGMDLEKDLFAWYTIVRKSRPLR